jgi:hypothetical protein
MQNPWHKQVFDLSKSNRKKKTSRRYFKMEKDNKNGLKWRGLATFLLSMGMLIEIVSGIVLYITPPGRYANWNNWTLWGLTKGEWGSVHTIFGYVLLIIVGLHLYFNWRVVVHFFWSRVKNSFNLKRELALSAVITVIIFAGTLWGIPPFSTVMDWGADAKRSWDTNSGVSSSRGNGRDATSSHDANSGIVGQRGRGRGSSASGWNADVSNLSNQAGVSYADSGRGQGRAGASSVFEANTRQTAEKLKGRDYVNLGKKETLAGVLAQVGDEWGLKVADTTYEIHMGPSDFRAAQGFVLKDGAEATVTGFIYGSNLSVTAMETGGQKVVLRDETGRAAWSGSSFSKGEGTLRTF